MAVAFKLFDPEGLTVEGEFGTSPFGTEVFGGSGIPGLAVIPDPEIQPGGGGGDSDDPTRDDRLVAFEIDLRRAGALLGRRTWKTLRRWDFAYFGTLSREQVETMRSFFLARRFKLLPNSADENTFWPVAWSDSEFRPKAQRGGTFSLAFSLEETP